MKPTFSRFTFLIFLLFFLINHPIVAKSIDKIPLNQAEKTAELLHDTIKEISQSAFLSENKIAKYLLQKNSNTKGKFELGVDFGLFSTNIEYTLAYEAFQKGQLKHEAKLHHSTMSGLNLANQLSKKWWLQTGVRFGRSTWSDNILFESFYNDSGEQILPNGEVRYDLILISSGQINESETKLKVSITNASSLDNGDWIVSSFSAEKQLDWIQIPIGVVYRFGEKRLNYEIKSGLSLNQITISNERFEGLIEGAVSRLVINEMIRPERDSKRFLETYLGAGIKYDLTEKIALNMNFNLRYSHNIKVVVTDVYTNFHFGASYLF